MSWEVDKTSLVLKVTGGPKETTWRIRKSINIADLSQILEDVWLSLQDDQTMLDLAQKLLPPVEVPTWDAEELAELDRYQAVQADSEQASRDAQAARVAKLNAGAKWWDADEEEGYGIPIPDYDSGEIQ